MQLCVCRVCAYNVCVLCVCVCVCSNESFAVVCGSSGVGSIDASDNPRLHKLK